MIVLAVQRCINFANATILVSGKYRNSNLCINKVLSRNSRGSITTFFSIIMQLYRMENSGMSQMKAVPIHHFI